MALHDPDSSAAEKAIALKIGRQKKIQIIDGQQVKPLKNYDNGRIILDTIMKNYDNENNHTVFTFSLQLHNHNC